MENADVDISVMMIVPLSHGGIVFHLREDLWTIYRSDEDQNLKILKFYAKLCESIQPHVRTVKHSEIRYLDENLIWQFYSVSPHIMNYKSVHERFPENWVKVQML